jgi:hypothetical protein
MALRTTTATLLAAACSLGIAAELTETETRWLRHGWPALAYAQKQGLPVDVVVLPAAKPGDAPLAMGFDKGRCKLVLAMRGNPAAESTIDGIPASLRQAAVEAMMAHEVAHCWRHVKGHWHSVPAGFSGTAGGSSHTPTSDTDLARWRADMHRTRREEGFADLVGLAWTQERHPHLYADVHAWLAALRAEQPVPGAHHDTRAWIRLAADPRAFASAPTPFEAVEALWTHGLASTGQPRDEVP